jgi:hypothetical protein
MTTPSPTITFDDAARLLSIALERYITTDAGERVFPLREVAAMTGMSHRALLDDCRADRLEHVHRGDLRGMTRRQIALLVARYSRGGDLAAPSTAAGDDLAEARRLSRQSGARRAPRRPA